MITEALRKLSEVQKEARSSSDGEKPRKGTRFSIAGLTYEGKPFIPAHLLGNPVIVFTSSVHRKVRNGTSSWIVYTANGATLANSRVPFNQQPKGRLAKVSRNVPPQHR